MARKKHIDQVDEGQAEDPREVGPVEKGGDKWQAALRPRDFSEYIGQAETIKNLETAVLAARKGGWALDHFLFAGPPGLGKTTLAHVIANELGVQPPRLSGPAIDHKGNSRRC